MGEFSGQPKLIGARERYESIHDHDELSHVLAPKSPIKSDPKRCEMDERKITQKGSAVELKRKATSGESKEVARRSSTEMVVAWLKRDDRALSACSVGMAAIVIGKPRFFNVCVAALRDFSRRLSTDHCYWTVWIIAKKQSDDLAAEASLELLQLSDPLLGLVHPALPLLGLRHRTWGNRSSSCALISTHDPCLGGV
jgi:hypothetical protein